MKDTPGIARRLLDWYAREARDLPWRRTSDPYAVWVSEVMLQQTQVQTVIPYWERWMRALPDVRSLAAADEDRLLKLWEGLGYYRRVRHLQVAAREICDRHSGVLPREVEAWQSLPGVGRYTAGAVCSIAYNQAAPIVDGNVARVLSRLAGIGEDVSRGPGRRRLWGLSEVLVRAAAATGRPGACGDFNQALMELGAMVCLPLDPACDQCPLRRRCRARGQGRVEDYPRRPRPVPLTARQFVVVVASWRGRYCVRQRPAGGVNGGYWEFPNEEVDGGETSPEAVALGLFGTRWNPLERVGEVRHGLTRYRITQRVYRGRLERLTPAARQAGKWKTLSELESMALTRAHRRVLSLLTE